MEAKSKDDRGGAPLSLGAAYLDYCVRQGWLTRTGEGDNVQYELTPAGERKMVDVPFNFDLSTLAKKGEEPKRKRRRRR